MAPSASFRGRRGHGDGGAKKSEGTWTGIMVVKKEGAVLTQVVIAVSCRNAILSISLLQVRMGGASCGFRVGSRLSNGMQGNVIKHTIVLELYIVKRGMCHAGDRCAAFML